MVFYAGKLVLTLNNPTIVLLTDRNDLDDQLFGVFSRCSDILRQTPVQAGSREELKKPLSVASGGIIFTTIQKFFPDEKGGKYPQLSDRSNIIVIADEAHRSQYRELAMNLRKAIPNASFMGFTATPIEFEDRDTYLVFGEPISIYSMDKARRHNVVVPIYYEARLAELHLMNEIIDEEFEEITEDVIKDPEVKENIKRKFAKLEEIMLAEERIKKVAKDIVEQF